MTVVYAAVMTLIIAAALGPTGIGLWAAVWCVITYRATSGRRNSGGKLTEGLETSDG